MSSFNEKMMKFIKKKKTQNLSSNERRKILNLEKQLLEKATRKVNNLSKSLSNSKLSGLDKIGKNIITMEKMSIHDWISQNNDNCAIIVKHENDKILLINRSDIDTVNLRNILLECVIEKNQLLVQETFKSKNEWIDMKYITGSNIVVDLNSIKNVIKKNNVLELTERFTSEFISKERLMLSQIGLTNKKLHKEVDPVKHKMGMLQEKKNLPYKQDVYFELILHKALHNYSYQWDAAINSYLRFGETYFTTDLFKKFEKRYGGTHELACQAIRNKVIDIDRAFIEAAPRNENSAQVFYRGMTSPFSFKNLYDKEIIKNYMSVSTDYNIAVQFSGIREIYDYTEKKFKLNKMCCLYKITVDRGIPFINMINTTKYKHEKEILLPRNLLFTLISVDTIKFSSKSNIEVPIVSIHATLSSPDQFKIKTGCIKYTVCNIRPLQYKQEKTVKSSKKHHIEKIEEEIKENSFNNIKRCPKGTRKNKATGLCESNDKSTTKTKTTTAKQPRCPNGMRRNPKTKQCEPKS